MEMLSLVLVTRGRTRETARFLRSLHSQHVPAELLLVDQNDDDRLDAVLAETAPPFPLVRLRSGPGLSRGRNVALAHATGRVVAFPDDDCAYPDGVLGRVLERFDARPDVHGLIGRAESESGEPMLRYPDEATPLHLTNLGRAAVSCAVFLRREVVDTVGLFDETLGPGAGTPWGAADETDYLMRALRSGFTLEYTPDVVVEHPHARDRTSAERLVRATTYGRANGRVWRRHGVPLAAVARGVLGPLLRAAGQAVRGRRVESLYHWRTFRARLAGWLDR